MARTQAEIRSLLDGCVGRSIAAADGSLQGQCVSLIKELMAFVGVANPRAGRGNAAQCGDAYIAQGIGTAGQGWLTICVNRSMAAPYGHIWIDLRGESNYEQNGARALLTTKNTRPISQAQQFVNFDKWVTSVSVAFSIWRVDKAEAAVRSQPNSSAPQAGSKLLVRGNTFVGRTQTVTGEMVSGNNQWIHSQVGNYVWSGGITRIS